MNTVQRFIPKDATPVDNQGTDADIYFYQTLGGKLAAIGYHGKSGRPDFHYIFRSPESRAKHVADYLAGRKASAKMKAEAKAARSGPHTLTPGAILRMSWGYDQTNVDFYEVTDVRGPHTVVLRELAQDQTETGFMQGRCSPRPGVYIGEPMVKRANPQNTVRIKSYASAYPWDGREARWSSYA